jgi:DNA-directed RNA polymerase beta' subunit
MGRAVIACNTAIAPDEVIIPLEFAMTVLAKETVRSYNFERLNRLFKNGKDIYPGAEFVVKPDGRKFQIGSPNLILEEGDILHRHMQNGDVVMMNR